MNCYNCGTVLREGDPYCPNCRHLNKDRTHDKSKTQDKNKAQAKNKTQNGNKTPDRAGSGKTPGTRPGLIPHYPAWRWMTYLVALAITVLFFFDWFSISFFIISLSGNVTELADSLSSLVNMLDMDTSWFSTLTWGLRAYYLIPVTQGVYILTAFVGVRFSGLLGKIAAWSTLVLTGLFIAAEFLINSRLDGLVDYTVAPICMLVLSLINVVMLIALPRVGRKKDKAALSGGRH